MKALIIIIVASLASFLGYFVSDLRSQPAMKQSSVDAQVIDMQLSEVLQEKKVLQTHLANLQDSLDAQLSIEWADDSSGDSTSQKSAGQQSKSGEKLFRYNRERKRHLDLFKMLDMSPEEQTAFLDLIAQGWKEYEVISYEVSVNTENNQLSQEEQQIERDRQVAAAKASASERLREFLGDNDYAVYEEYAESINTRSSINQFSSSLDKPLDGYAKEAVIRIVAEETKRAEDTNLPSTSRPSAAELKERLAMQEDVNLKSWIAPVVT